MRIKAKLESYAQVDKVKADMMASLGESPDAQPKKDADHIFHELQEHVMQVEALEKGVRLDGRKFDEIRPIWTETGVLPRVHGSVVFTRGETQALVTCTLGTADDEQKVEHVTGEFYKRFMLHYNFPPFSVGETGRFTGPGRREVGHGALAERALAPLIPAEDKFAYTIRIVSDILESNGSSSMASVCGGSMAMMDAGVPLASPVAGIAMGLIMDEKTGKYAVLSDIAGAEDHYGDMDFKVAGTADGHHRAADGHQGHRHQLGDHGQGAGTGARRPDAHPRRDGQDARRHARQHVGLRAAHHHDQDSGRQDPRRHRPRRQDDPQHHRAHRREDRRRGQRHGERRVGRRRVGGQGHLASSRS